MKKCIFLLLWITLLLPPRIRAQEQKVETIKSRFSESREQAYQEKLYLHIDRNFYLTGETMWFRIYQVDGAVHKPANLSKVGYVEILDRENNPVVQVKIELKQNGGQGTVFIPATLPTGNYVVRAYTQWMKNFSPEFYFHKTVSIVNPFIRPEGIANTKAATVKVDFFPEGGNLVSGIRSKVAFRIQGGSPEEKYTGFIVTESNDTLVTFQPLTFGLGHFYLTPAADEQYRCVVTGSNGSRTTQALPPIHETGFVMQLSDTLPDRIRVRVYGGNRHALTYAYLFVHARQIMVHAEMKPLQSAYAEFVVERDKIPDGISHFTVFNEDLKPVCERLYFRKPETTLAVRVRSDQQEYSPRRKVSLDVQTMTGSENVPASLSLSVFRLDSLGEAENGNIVPWLYLTSDLKGDIESPGFYFTDDPLVREATENLMLTHGWRRFNWDDVFSDKRVYAHVPEMRTHIVSGRVTDSQDQPAENVLTFLASPSKLININSSRSNRNGELVFEVQDFYGSRKLVLQPGHKSDSTLRLSIVNPFSKRFAELRIPPLALSSDARDELNLRSISMQVQDVYFRELNDKPVAIVRDSAAFYGIADQTYYLENYTRFPVLEEVMREYVPGVMVRIRRDGFHFLVIDAKKKGVLEGDPLILLDGVPVLDLNRMMRFDPLRIRKLEVVMRSYILGPARVPGIVSYSTYNGDLAGFEFPPPAVIIDYEGLQVQREFYSPSYDNSRLRSNRLPDQRTLLFWKPVLETTGGNGAVEFYTSDVPGTYKVVIQGLTKDGQAGSGSHTFTVNGIKGL